MSPQARRAAIAANCHRAIAFWRSLGYRRIGTSTWFGTALEAGHKVHELASDSDYNPPEREEVLSLEYKDGVAL